MSKLIYGIKAVVKHILLSPVYLYRYCISPIIPHACKFSPSCSKYMIESIIAWGFFKGFNLGMKRIFRCNRRAKGGIDRVPINIKGDYKWVM